MAFHKIEHGVAFDLFGCSVLPIPVHHGNHFTTPPTPYLCLSFLFDSSILYMSDASFIPEEAFQLISTRCTVPWQREQGSPANQTVRGPDCLPKKGEKPALQVLLLDVLSLSPHPSHLHIGEAVVAARQLGAARTYLVSFL